MRRTQFLEEGLPETNLQDRTESAGEGRGRAFWECAMQGKTTDSVHLGTCCGRHPKNSKFIQVVVNPSNLS